MPTPKEVIQAKMNAIQAANPTATFTVNTPEPLRDLSLNVYTWGCRSEWADGKPGNGFYHSLSKDSVLVYVPDGHCYTLQGTSTSSNGMGGVTQYQGLYNTWYNARVALGQPISDQFTITLSTAAIILPYLLWSIKMRRGIFRLSAPMQPHSHSMGSLVKILAAFRWVDIPATHSS